MNDDQAYDLYPKDRWVYDKRQIAIMYDVNFYETIPDNKKYCIKPIINLDGCSINSKIVSDLKGFKVPNRTRAFDFLEGTHWTADYEYDENDGWIVKNIFIGEKFDSDHTKFKKWSKVLKSTDNEYMFVLPKLLESVLEAPIVNVEYIGNKAIETHLRGNTDPVEWDIICPFWSNQNFEVLSSHYFNDGYKFIVDKENHPGRLGFFVKMYGENKNV